MPDSDAAELAWTLRWDVVLDWDVVLGCDVRHAPSIPMTLRANSFVCRSIVRA